MSVSKVCVISEESNCFSSCF